MKPFNRELLTSNLGQLSKRHRIAFAASCTARLLPNYSVFCREVNWGDPELFKTVLDSIWESLDGEALSEVQVQLWVTEVNNLTPRDWDFSCDTTAAQNAGIALIHTLRCFMDGSAEEAAWAANAAMETVDAFVQINEEIEANDPELEVKINSHLFMVRELRKQNDDLKLLRSDRTLSTITLLQLRHGWQNGCRSNIDLG